MRQVVDKTTGEITEYTDAEFIIKRDELFVKWQAAQHAVEAAKTTEQTLRQQCVDFAFDQEKQSGTERIELGNGYEAKAVKKINYGFIKGKDEKTDRKAIEKALSKIEAEGAAGELIAERLVDFKPTLSVSEYKKLDEKHRKIIDAVIVTTEGMPTLEIIEPKAK